VTDAALVFAHAQAVVGDQIHQAAVRTGGNAEQTLGEVLRWADERPERRPLLIQSVRHRVGCLPVIDEMVDSVFELVGGDEDAADAIIQECINSPLLRERLDRQIAELAAKALLGWVREACAEERVP
jgi:hypothetical protein